MNKQKLPQWAKDRLDAEAESPTERVGFVLGSLIVLAIALTLTIAWYVALGAIVLRALGFS